MEMNRDGGYGVGAEKYQNVFPSAWYLLVIVLAVFISITRSKF